MCKAGFVLHLTGASCLEESKCNNRGGKVQNGRCVCDLGYAANLEGDACVDNCGSGAEIPDPSALGQTCKCKAGFALSLDQTKCVNPQICGPNTVASESGCKCADGYYQTLAATCKQMPDEYEDPCGKYQ